MVLTLVIIQAPQLDINTVAAGGGSRLFYKHGMFVVGPEVSTRHIGCSWIVSDSASRTGLLP